MSLEPTHVELSSPVIKHLMTKMRNKDTPSKMFRVYADRLHRFLAEEALARFPHTPVQVETPCGVWDGVQCFHHDKLCVVSIIRAGDSLLQAVLDICPGVGVGKVLIQRDERNAQPQFYYAKFPPDIAERYVLLVDPMLGTGGSARCAIRKLVECGVQEDHIMFLNVISCPEGLKALRDAFPKVQVVTGQVDEGLNEKWYLVPGIGDYGDRYFATQ